MVDIRLINVHKHFFTQDKHKVALNGVNIDINQGDFILISGSSGSGKTTLLMTIGGLVTPDKGNIYLNRDKLKDLSSHQKNKLRAKYFSYVFQNNILLGDFTVIENVLFPFQVKEKNIDKKIVTKALHLLENFGLLDFSNKKVGILSGGEQQLVNFIRGLLPNSPVILADEPTSELDEKLCAKVFQYLKNLNQKNNTSIILISHSEMALNFAKEFYHMQEGKLIDYQKLSN